MAACASRVSRVEETVVVKQIRRPGAWRRRQWVRRETAVEKWSERERGGQVLVNFTNSVKQRVPPSVYPRLNSNTILASTMLLENAITGKRERERERRVPRDS